MVASHHCQARKRVKQLYPASNLAGSSFEKRKPRRASQNDTAFFSARWRFVVVVETAEQTAYPRRMAARRSQVVSGRFLSAADAEAEVARDNEARMRRFPPAILSTIPS